jgi:tetratricopeptide (TPR) repeat protein
MVMFILSTSMTVLPACSSSPPAPDGDKASDTPAAPASAAPDKARQTEFADMIQDARGFLRKEDTAAASRIIDRGLADSREAGRDWELFYAEFQLLSGNLRRAGSDPLEALRKYADAMAIFRVHNSAQGQFEGFLELASLEEDRGDFAAAERQLTEAEAHIPRIDDKKLLARYEVCRGRIDAGRLNHAAAIKRFAEAATIFSRAGDKLSQAEALLLQASSEDAIDDVRSARGSIDKAGRLYTEENFTPGIVRTTHRLAILAAREGQYKKARELLSKARSLYLTLGKTSDAAKIDQHINALPE